MEGLTYCWFLQELYLTKNEIEEIPVGSLDGLYSIRELWLGNNRIKEIAGFDELTMLMELRMNKNLLTTIQGLDSCVKL